MSESRMISWQSIIVVLLAIGYSALIESLGLVEATHLFFSIFLLYIFYRMVRWRRSQLEKKMSWRNYLAIGSISLFFAANAFEDVVSATYYLFSFFLFYMFYALISWKKLTI